MNNQSSTVSRIFTWIGLIVVLGLIVWGLIAANNKAVQGRPKLTLLDPVTSADWITGSTTAPVTVVEYSDLQCPACQSYHNLVLKKLIAEEGSKFRFVYRHFPLPQHMNAYTAALAAEAAGKQGKFWEMHDKLFETQKDWEKLATSTAAETFAGYAKTLGLDAAKFKSDESDPALFAKVASSSESGNKTGVDSTPTFFVNGTSIDNPNSYDEFKAVIEKAAQ
ncbi:MAG: hypothetical protein JWO73_401 [Candidatus Taylorbacteria bacterium]|nr:hypothetical protein [Candidatus Taylorbacteria bacterium]